MYIRRILSILSCCLAVPVLTFGSNEGTAHVLRSFTTNEFSEHIKLSKGTQENDVQLSFDLESYTLRELMTFQLLIDLNLANSSASDDNTYVCGTDISSLSREELLNIQKEIEKEIERNHKEDESKMNTLFDLTETEIINRMPEASNIALIDNNYIREWDLYILDAVTIFDDAEENTDYAKVYSAMYPDKGEYNLVFFQIEDPIKG